nr:hypothetical protein [Tanacetum cinerariifolium]
MASNLKNVRSNVLLKLQEALDEEAILEKQILTLMHHFADNFTDRKVEINNLMVLQDHPLINYGKYALGCMTGADMKKYGVFFKVLDTSYRSRIIRRICCQEVIENGNSWVSIPQTRQEDGVSVTKMSVPATAEEKINKKNDVKARSLLLMALPNEHQLTFSQYNDDKSMFAAIKTRFRGLVITQEDLNSKFLRSLPPEWNTHVVVWMNKADIETMSIDDLYNNFKIVEQEVKKSVDTSTGAQNMAFMNAPNTSSINDVNTANPAYKASTVSSNVNTVSRQVSTSNFSDNAVYAFMVENPNGSNLLHQDLEQIHEDDMKAIDLRWQLSLLSMMAKRECKAQRNQDGQFRNQDNTKKQGNNEDTSSKAILAIDGVGFDSSDMEEEHVQTNMALMASSDSEVHNDKSWTKNYLKNYETLKKQCDDLIVKLNQTKFTAATYKKGLATVEEQLVTYKKNEVLFSEEVAVLKREVACKNYEIMCLKSLDKLIGSQITDNSKKGLGYHAIPPPHPLIYNGPRKLDLSYSGLDEFKEPEFKGYGLRDSKQESKIIHDKKLDDFKENSDDSFVKEQVSEDTSSFVESPLNVDKETTFFVDNKIEFVKPKNHDKPVKKSVRYAEMYRSQRPREVMLHLGEEHMVVEFLVGDETVYKEWGYRMERAATTASSLEAKQDSAGLKETASASTLKDGKMKITATIDGKIKTVTEASIRRHLRLEDSDGITTLPNIEIFEQLALRGCVFDYDRLTFNKGNFSPQWRASKAFNKVDIPLFPTMLVSGHIDQGIETTVPVESHQTPTNAPSTSQPLTLTPSMQPTHDAAEHDTMPHYSPLLRVQSLGSVEGSLTLNKLIVICTSLSKKVEDLQYDLQQTKLTHGAAYTKLILRERTSADTEILLDQEEPTKLVEDLGSGEKDPIAPPIILTPSTLLPPSLLFDHRYFFVPEELLPLKKQTLLPSLSFTDLSNPSRKQAYLILIFCPKVEMSRDVLTYGFTMRIPLLYRGELSQWVERFMNYLEEQTDGEAMINLIKNGDQPLPRVTQVSIAELPQLNNLL